MANGDGFDFLNTSQQTRQYVSGGQTPTGFVEVLQSSNGVYICTISGYLVDVPAGNSSIVMPPGQHRLPAPFGR